MKMCDTRGNIVGHLPMEVSRITKFRLDRGARIEATLRSTHYRQSPLVQGGLEIPCTVKVSMMPTQLSKKLVDRYRKLIESFYFEPPDSEVIGHFSNQMKRKLLVQLVEQVAGKMYLRKNQRSEKMVIVTFVQSLPLWELKISEATLSIPPL